LDRLGDVFRPQRFFSGEIGNGPRDLEDLVVAPGREAEFVDGHFEEFLAFFVQRAILLDLPVIHVRVGVNAGILKSLLLDLPGTDGSFPDL
jgi:hypothetical protein